MKKYAFLLFILFSAISRSNSLPSQTAFTPDQIVNEKVDKVNQQNQLVAPPGTSYGIFQTAETSNGVNFSSITKTQQVGLDLNTEAEGLRQGIISDQTAAGSVSPQGCADTTVLSAYQNNVCLAAFTLQSMGIEAVGAQGDFRVSADQAHQTMEDVAAFPLDGSAAANFAADQYGLPAPSNLIFQSNKAGIDSFHQLFKSLAETSEYKGLKFSTKNEYFYLDGKKYSTSVLMSKDAMIKAGINKSIADFAYSMLAKKSAAAQDKIMSLLKSKGLYDGKNWSIFKSSAVMVSSLSKNNSGIESPVEKANQLARTPGSVMDSIASLVEEKTLSKTIDGIQLGLSSDDIFKIISRKYREKDKLGFFHNSPKK